MPYLLACRMALREMALNVADKTFVMDSFVLEVARPLVHSMLCSGTLARALLQMEGRSEHSRNQAVHSI